MKNKSNMILFGIVFFFLFLAFSFLVKKNLFTHFDFSATVKIQNKLSRRLDIFFGLFSFIARAEILTFILFVVLLARKKISEFAVLGIFVLGHLIEYIGKLLLYHPGPIALFYRQDSLPMFRDYVKPGSSYPSGHSFRAVFLAIIFSALILSFNNIGPSKKYAILTALFLFVFFVCLAKVALGQHWVSDVIGGVFLGISLGFLSLPLLKTKK